MTIGIDGQQVVKRLTVTLDDATHAALTQWADEEARTVPNLLVWLALKGLDERTRKDTRSQQPSNQQDK